MKLRVMTDATMNILIRRIMAPHALNRSVTLLLVFTILLPIAANADMVSPLQLISAGISNSLELLFSLEKYLSPLGSFMWWGGGGLITAVAPDPFDTVEAGFEWALEYRRYLKKEWHGFFLGLYTGMGYMHRIGKDGDENRVVLGCGIKWGYKALLYQSRPGNRPFRIDCEPYLSLGFSSYYRPDQMTLFNPDRNSCWLNVGVRMVFEYPLH